MIGTIHWANTGVTGDIYVFHLWGQRKFPEQVECFVLHVDAIVPPLPPADFTPYSMHSMSSCTWRTSTGTARRSGATLPPSCASSW